MTDKSIGKYISILSRQAQIYINRELKVYDITSSEYIFLINVPDYGDINQKQICDEFSIDQAMATRSMKSLEKKGLVHREKNPSDKRAYMISLTEKGKKIKPIIIEKLDNWTKLIAGDMSEADFNTVLETLKYFSENAVKEVQNDPNE